MISELGAEGFSDFIKGPLKKRNKILNGSVLYKRQSWWVHNFKYDFIGRFENLQSDFNKVCGKLGLSEHKLGTFNAMDRIEYQHYYDEETAEIIHNLYKKDIERFNYKF
jgi:hypothetical protein